MHFFDYLNRYINSIFKHKYKKEIEKSDFKKQLFKDLKKLKTSIIDNTGNILYTTLIDNPQTYITTVGLYNDNNELLAVAKLSKPLVKDFTKEALIRIKLDY